eukprot:11514.XXX_685852_684879_1 [CDS] Oithona nana genome sequencing.
MSPSLQLLLVLLTITLLVGETEGNLRCYSCAPCNELELYAGDVTHFEQDCYLDRYCMKISGITQDIFGYRREVSIRGCPIVSLFTRLEEGCTGTSLTVAGLGLVEGVVCFCNGHLCNNSPP